MHINNKFSSPNYSERLGAITFIILHYTEMKFDRALLRLCDESSKVSAHYLIKEDGEIFQLVKDKYSAWHAGESSWLGIDKINEHSIGIELDNLGTMPFSGNQLQSCITLCNALSDMYDILPQNILGHSDIAPERKIDPGLFFDWPYLGEFGIGIWPEKVISSTPSKVLCRFGDKEEKGEQILNMQNNLLKLGYKIEPTGIFDLQTNYVVRAFQAHFNPSPIKNLGIEFYRDNTSKYEWDSISDQILRALIT